MGFRQGLRFTISYLAISFILCVCIAAFLYLSNMVGEALFQLTTDYGITLKFFGMEATLSAEAAAQLTHRARQLFYFLPPYERFILRVVNFIA